MKRKLKEIGRKKGSNIFLQHHQSIIFFLLLQENITTKTQNVSNNYK
ncbi:hypothetical protein KSS87_000087 [Heliosperma pusillum]|nr:hypothetical protein KSS87_000087 [Heliosperma pusillum]